MWKTSATFVPTKLQALLFDVDGTLAETEEAHRRAFNASFKAVGLDWHWDPTLYAQLLAVAGGRERIGHYVATRRPELLTETDLDRRIVALHADKTRRYAEMVAAGAVHLRKGVARLLSEVRAAGLRLAITTTTSRANVDVLLQVSLGAGSVGWFEVIGAGADVSAKKPAADIYQWVLERLGLEADACLAIEDSESGLHAALGAGVATVITPSAYTVGQDFSAAVAVVSDLGEPGKPFRVLQGCTYGEDCVNVALLRRWHAAAYPLGPAARAT